jgi:hypothetical protein
MSVYKTTRRYNTEHKHRHLIRCEDLKSHTNEYFIFNESLDQNFTDNRTCVIIHGMILELSIFKGELLWLYSLLSGT